MPVILRIIRQANWPTFIEFMIGLLFLTMGCGSAFICYCLGRDDCTTSLIHTFRALGWLST